MATTRLRKSFQYPTDDSEDDDTPGDLDEEEQERYIEQLKKKDQDRNEMYKRITVFLPIIAALSFLPTLTTSPVYQARLSSLLSVTSLLSTAYTLYFVPTNRPTDKSGGSLLTQPKAGPLMRYMEPANGVLSALLGLNAVIYKGRPGIHEHLWLMSLLPFFCFIVITLARRIMVEVDIGELERLKYGYKGA